MQGSRQRRADRRVATMAAVRRSVAVPLALLLLVLAACVEEARPSGCAGDSVEIHVELEADRMTPSALGVCRGQHVTLIVATELDATFHVHGYDDALPATTISVGDEARLEFDASRAGQFPIEIHPADDPRGIEVGILTVYAT